MTIIAGPNAATPEEQEAKMQQALKGTIIMRDLTNTLSEEPPLKSVEERVADIMPWLGEDINEGADYEMPMLAQPPKTAEEMVAAMEPWLSENINGDSDTITLPGQEDPNKAPYMYFGEKSDVMGMIENAGVHIYVVAKSDSPTFTPEVVEALKKAYTDGVEIHVALSDDGIDFPKHWESLKSSSTTFRTDIPSYRLEENKCGVIIADDKVYTEAMWHRGNVLTRYCKTETNILLGWHFAEQFFGKKPYNSFVKPVEHYKKLLQEQLDRYKSAVAARVKIRMGGIFQEDNGRYTYKRLLEIDEIYHPKPKSRAKQQPKYKRKKVILGVSAGTVIGLLALGGLLRGCSEQSQEPVHIDHKNLPAQKDTGRQNSGN